MLNVYEQVSANKIKSFLIIILFTAFIIGAAYLIVNVFELNTDFLFFASIFSLGSSLISYFWGDKIVLGLNHAQPASRQKYFNFYTIAENLSIAQNTPMPKLYVIEDSSPNAFATGRDPKHAVVAVTTGLLSKLDRTELEGVIAHELSHIKNYDIRLMMIVSILIGTLSILINTASRSIWYGGDREGDRKEGNILTFIGLALLIFAPLIAQLINLAISRSREYLADASGVKLTRQPQGLINALIKISSDPTPMRSASTATASLYISNPFKNNKIASLFSSHPPVEDRIRILQQML